MIEGLYVGLMSGTSADGIDAALVEIRSGTVKFLSSAATHYEDDLRSSLVRLNNDPKICLADYIRLDNRVGAAFAAATHALLESTNVNASDVIAIGSHGQTIFHLPDDLYPGTLQIGNPSLIAARTGIDTIADFRRADMAIGGQGAPLAPAFHASVLGSSTPTIVLNLGGIANITFLPTPGSGEIAGYDTGPANTLMDAWSLEHLGVPFDANGSWARSGTINPPLLALMLNDPFFRKPAPKSTGLDYFNRQWLEIYLAQCPSSPADVQATLLELTASSIADEIHRLGMQQCNVLLCGGGAHNTYQVERLSSLLGSGYDVGLTADKGVNVDYCEAIAFAWLAHCHKADLPGNIVSVTGAQTPTVLGGFYPATRPGQS